MNASQRTAVATLILSAAACFAGDPIQVHVRYLNAAIWPKTFDATPDNTTNIFSGSRSTNVVVSEELTRLTPVQFYKAAFGTNTPEIVWVTELRVWRYDPAQTNYSVAQYYHNRAMLRDTNFTTRLRDGDVVFFTGTVD